MEIEKTTTPPILGIFAPIATRKPKHGLGQKVRRKMHQLFDAFDRPVNIDDVVAVSRPSGRGSSEIALARVTKITKAMVSFRLLNLDLTERQPANRWESMSFHCQKNHGSDKCKKIMIYPI